MEHPELQFFNSLAGRLEIELSEPPQQISPNLENMKASPDARITRVRLVAEVFNRTDKSFRALTEDELNSIAFRSASIKLRGESETIVVHKAANGKHFTVRELLQAVEETERQTRDDSEWFDGVDVHHVFFEGLDQEDDDVWCIIWGS